MSPTYFRPGSVVAGVTAYQVRAAAQAGRPGRPFAPLMCGCIATRPILRIANLTVLGSATAPLRARWAVVLRCLQGEVEAPGLSLDSSLESRRLAAVTGSGWSRQFR